MKRKPAQYYNYKKRPKQAPGESLPKLPGVNTQKQFAEKFGLTKNVRRSYLNAQAQYAGYESYDTWLKARRKEGVERKNTSRVKRKKYETGQVYIFDFMQDGRFPSLLYEQRKAQIDKVIKDAPKGYFIQFHIQANKYGQMGEDSTPEYWGWISTPLIDLQQFIKKDLSRYPSAVDWILAESTKTGIPPYRYSKNGKNYTTPGIKEVHIGFWKQGKGNPKK